MFYTLSQFNDAPMFDEDFGARISWDVPLLEGYDHEFVPNVATHASLRAYRGIRNPKLAPAIEAWGAQAVLVYAWNLSSHLHALRYFKDRIPVFFRGDSTLLSPQPVLRSFARRLFLTWVYSHVDVAIAVGSNNRDYFEWCGMPADRVAFAPHSVDTDRFSNADGVHAARASAFRRDLGIPQDALVLVYAAKFVASKDPLQLLQAFVTIDPGTHLVFVGSGPLEGELKARAAGHANVHFLPFQNQSAMPAVYRLGDIFTLPARGPETWGLALNEAMASARAIIAGSQVGAVRDLIRHGVNGWSFESGNFEALVSVLRQALATDRETLRSMGLYGQNMIGAWSTQEAAKAIAATVSAHSERRQS